MFGNALWIRERAMDNVGALNVFVRAAEARSFTEAGRQLGVSSSAIGKARVAGGSSPKSKPPSWNWRKSSAHPAARCG